MAFNANYTVVSPVRNPTEEVYSHESNSKRSLVNPILPSRHRHLSRKEMEPVGGVGLKAA